MINNIKKNRSNSHYLITMTRKNNKQKIYYNQIKKVVFNKKKMQLRITNEID
jgi:hypothetical protein